MSENTAPDSVIKVAIVDDQTLVRSGISSLLSLSNRVEVVAQGDDGDAALGIAQQHQPDVFLMDIRMPKMNGIEAIKELRANQIVTPVMILTTFDDHQLVLSGLQAGAQGYLLKDVSLDSLIAAIETVHKGETFVQPAMEISEALHKSEGTIKNHVSNVLSKLGVRDRTRAVLRALEIGLI